MKTFRKYLIGPAILTASLSTSWALLIELDHPSVAFSTDYPDDQRNRIASVLKRKDSKFLGGAALSSFTSLRYGGDTRALNLFLDDLAKCAGVKLAISFAEDFPYPCDWRISHEAYRNRFHVQINLKSKTIQLQDLVLPEIPGAPTAPSHARFLDSQNML